LFIVWKLYNLRQCLLKNGIFKEILKIMLENTPSNQEFSFLKEERIKKII